MESIVQVGFAYICIVDLEDKHWYCQMQFYNDRGSTITKTYLYNFDPLKPYFYIVKLGFTGVYIIFLISTQ